MSLEFQIHESDFAYGAELASFKRSKFAIGLMMVLPIVGVLLIAGAVLVTTSYGSRNLAGLLLAIGSASVIMPMMWRLRLRRNHSLGYYDR